MRRQRLRDTAPELLVRGLVWRLGFRFRVSTGGIPGRPDLVHRRSRWAIFVHGCFWHQHPGCKRATMPKNNHDWWVAKFAANAERDARKIRELEAMGFRVKVVWECETKDPEALGANLRTWFESINVSPTRTAAEPDPERS
jgi:DNA mismatch endonuclease (patch repair protein)